MNAVLIATVVTVALAILFDFTNGFHDAANATSTVIATRSLKPKQAVVLSAVFNFLPAFVVGTAVANTISKTVKLDSLPIVAAGGVPYGIRVTLAALVGAIFWNYLTWHFGLPSSSSHALIGGLIGAGVSAGGLDAVSWDSVKKTVLAIFASPAVAFAIALIASLIVRALVKAFKGNEDSEFFRWAQVASSAWVSWGHGSNDAQKTMGIIVGLLVATKRRGYAHDHRIGLAKAREVARGREAIAPRKIGGELVAQVLEIVASLLERLDLVHRRHLVQRQCDVGMLGTKAPDDARQHAVQRGPDKPDRHRALDLAHAACHRFQFGRLRQQLARVRMEEAAGLRELERAAAALEQQHADFLFELLNLPAQGRLGDMQPLGRAGEVELFGNGDEVAQVA